jgi:hypothetical protein
MGTRSRFLALALSALAVSACGSGPQSGSTATLSPIQGRNTASGIVLSGPALREHNGSLLNFLYMRVSGMSVDRTGPCPDVRMRGQRSLFGSNSPIVYVDGARTANSCVLDMLHTTELSRVEVYPMGVSNRPGYEAHPNGLILVFMRNGPDGADDNDLRRVVMRD